MNRMGGVRGSVLASAIPLVAIVIASSARAQVATRGPAYELDLNLDLPVVLVAGATASSFLALPEDQTNPCVRPCDRSRINRFDRPAAGLNDPHWGTVGDIANAVTLATPLVAIVLDEGVKDGLNDDLVVAESALVASALQVTVSFAVLRPRPRVYGSDATQNANAGRSFFSGHVASSVATSVAALRTYQRLHKPALGWTLFGVGLAGSCLVGVARVASGAHFPSDVIAGGAVGAGFGLALPAVHGSPVRVAPFGDGRSGGLLVSGALP